MDAAAVVLEIHVMQNHHVAEDLHATGNHLAMGEILVQDAMHALIVETNARIALAAHAEKKVANALLHLAAQWLCIIKSIAISSI